MTRRARDALGQREFRRARDLLADDRAVEPPMKARISMTHSATRVPPIVPVPARPRSGRGS